MNIIRLRRWAHTPHGVFGTMTFGDFSCFTVERPWVNNQPRVSCIPDGMYSAIWHNSPRFGRTIAIVGGSVSLSPSPNHQRSAILIHQGNTMDELLGCIAVGDSLGMVNGRWAVLNSVRTLGRFHAAIPQTNSMIDIYTSFHE